jgi:hypothetical protein
MPSDMAARLQRGEPLKQSARVGKVRGWGGAESYELLIDLLLSGIEGGWRNVNHGLKALL